MAAQNMLGQSLMMAAHPSLLSMAGQGNPLNMAGQGNPLNMTGQGNPFNMAGQGNPLNMTGQENPFNMAGHGNFLNMTGQGNPFNTAGQLNPLMMSSSQANPLMSSSQASPLMMSAGQANPLMTHAGQGNPQVLASLANMMSQLNVGQQQPQLQQQPQPQQQRADTLTPQQLYQAQLVMTAQMLGAPSVPPVSVQGLGQLPGVAGLLTANSFASNMPFTAAMPHALSAGSGTPGVDMTSLASANMNLLSMGALAASGALPGLPAMQAAAGPQPLTGGSVTSLNRAAAAQTHNLQPTLPTVFTAPPAARNGQR